MAKMTELPYELLHYIMLLLVQSPGGAADFARIVSVCKNFLLFAQDKSILELVNFDMRMELTNFKRYQHINSLLVRCSEAGNVAAQFSLGKTRLVHYQLVRLFLLHGSPNDLAEMSVYLKSYVKFFTSVTEEDNPLLRNTKDLISHADGVRVVEKQLMDIKRCIADSEGFEHIRDAISFATDFMERTFAESRARTLRFFELNLG